MEKKKGFQMPHTYIIIFGVILFAALLTVFIPLGKYDTKEITYMQNGVEKTLLRDACADLLPTELLHRKKSPYPKTYHPGYEKLLADHLRRIISDPNAPVYPLIDPKKAEAFLAAPKELGRPWFGQLMAGPQLMAYFIQLNDWMGKYHLSV